MRDITMVRLSQAGSRMHAVPDLVIACKQPQFTVPEVDGDSEVPGPGSEPPDSPVIESVQGPFSAWVRLPEREGKRWRMYELKWRRRRSPVRTGRRWLGMKWRLSDR